MARIILAGASEANRAQFSRLLTSSGFTVFRCCASGGELRRAINACPACVAILLGAVPDCRPEELQADFGGSVRILWIAPPALLESADAAGVFRLPLPVSGQMVVGAVEMLAQMQSVNPPRRTTAPNKLVEQAKALLMEKHGMTEPEAHHALQQYAMRRGMKLADYAARILETAKTKEDS